MAEREGADVEEAERRVRATFAAVETVTDMSKSLAGEVSHTVHHVAGALESVYKLDGFNVAQANGVPAGQEVFHAHVHVIPRCGDDTLALGWCGETADETTHQEIAATVRGELTS